MDIISHGIAGAVTGLYYNMPIQGGIIAILPDLMLGVKRKLTPNVIYRVTHSVILIPLMMLVSENPFLWLWCLLSHLFLDLFTHGDLWSPRLLFPFSDMHPTQFEEWEFGNRSWLCGLILTLIWCIVWLFLQK